MVSSGLLTRFFLTPFFYAFKPASVPVTHRHPFASIPYGRQDRFQLLPTSPNGDAVIQLGDPNLAEEDRLLPDHLLSYCTGRTALAVAILGRFDRRSRPSS